MSEKLAQSPKFQRFGEILTPLLAWIIILLPIWLSPFHPAVVAYFIIVFDLHFLYKAIRTAYYATLSYSLIHSFQDTPFAQKLQTLDNAANIQHFIIIPNYKEPLHKLNDTIRALAYSDYPYNNLHLVLAFEKREKEAVDKAHELKQLWGKYFKDVISTYHVLVEPEVAGKASNQTHAAKVMAEYCEKKGYKDEDVVVTICDADSMLAANYFSYLTIEYLTDKLRQYHFYWAPVLLYNNFWQLPFFVRMQATMASVLRLAFLSEKEQLIHISTYSTNLWLLKEVNYWDVDIIPEDWHIYLQAFFKFGEKVKTLPLYTIVNGDAVYSGSAINTLKNRYEQEKRWAWGVTDISYFWNNLFTTPHINWKVKLKKFAYLLETHLFWPTSFFILTISGFIPGLVNPVFKRTVMGFILPQMTAFILTLATAMLLLYIFIDIKLRDKLKIQTNMVNLPLLLVQWYFLPVISFILSSLPALDAHTRLLIGKKIKYKVTEKV